MPRKTDQLSHRQKQIVQLKAQGRSDKEIATDLGMKPGTVGTHRKRIFEKLGVHTMMQVIAKLCNPDAPGDE